MTLFSGTDLPVLLAAPIVAGAVGGFLYVQAWRQARHRRRAVVEAASAQSAAAVARAASTSPAP